MLAALMMLAVACGSDDEPSATTSTTSPATSSTTAAPETTNESTTTKPSTTLVPTTTLAPPPTWQGEEIQLFAQDGDELGVIGVEYFDRLNVRAGPGTEYDVVARLRPTDTANATGRAWQIPNAIWYEIEIGGVTGWANTRFLAFLGGVDDITSEIVAARGEIPTGGTMIELALIVAQQYVTDEPPTRIVLTEVPTFGDLGEVTYDLVGFGDDALVGFRIHVFGQPVEGEEGFSLRSVERTLLCGRGASCV